MAEEDENVRLVYAATSPKFLGFIRGHVCFMKHQGFEIHVVTSPGERLDRFARETGVRAHAVPMPRRITPFRDIGAVRSLCRYFRQIQPHIVHANTPKAGMLATIAAWRTRVPVRIYHMRGLPMLAASGYRRTLLRWSEQVACRLANQVLCVSHSIRDLSVQHGLCPADKIKVLHNGSGQGVDAAQRFDPGKLGERAGEEMRARLSIPEGSPVVGFVGRIVRDKGVVELVEAWQTLGAELPAAHLLLVGEREPQDPIPDSIRRVIEEDRRIHVTGWVDEVVPYYAAMDVVVLPSYREGFPNVPLEAAAMGLPVVATRIAGCVEAVQDGVTGTLVDVRDAAAVAEAVGAYLRDSALRREHGQAGRERVLRDYRPEDIQRATLAGYVRLLREHRQPVPTEANPARQQD